MGGWGGGWGMGGLVGDYGVDVNRNTASFITLDYPSVEKKIKLFNNLLLTYWTPVSLFAM